MRKKIFIFLAVASIISVALLVAPSLFISDELPKEQTTKVTDAKLHDDFFQSVCQRDPKVPKEWVEYEFEAYKRGGCARPFRYVAETVVGEPTSDWQENGASTPFCGIEPNEDFMAGRESGVHFSPGYRIHVVGITDSIHQSESSPQVDYEKYFKFIVEGFNSMSDSPSNFQITFSQGYKEVEKDFSKLRLGYSNLTEQAQNKLTQQVIDLIDPELDFSQIDTLFIFVPPSISPEIFHHSGPYSGGFQSEEGYVSRPFLSGTFEAYDHPSWIPHGPIGLMHEIFHMAGGVIDDHYGEWQPGSDEYKQKGPAPGGTGEWGNMSGILMDWLAWDKYLAQLITEDQLRCANRTDDEVVWLRPSSHDSADDKLLLIPTGKTTAIAVESIRGSGFNYKIPSKYHGALVYEIDTSVSKHGLGVRVIRPDFRAGPGWDPYRRKEFDFALADAALKAGEVMTFKDFQIEVLEAGDFGDVVRVSSR